MGSRFIEKLHIDWDEIDRNSYLNGISSLRQIEELDFTKNITFFVGEN